MSVPTPRLETHDLRNLIINFGEVSVEGFGPNDVLTIRRLTSNFSSLLGLHGAVVPIMSKDQRARATITIMRESDNNVSLSIISALDSISGLGSRPFLAQYANFNHIYSSVQSRVVREPDLAFGPKNGFLTWEFELYRFIRFG